MAIDNRDDMVDENYFEAPKRGSVTFDAALLREPVSALPVKRALTVSPSATVTEAMRLMQTEHTGCVIITDDGTSDSKLIGIFTERDVLFRVVDRGRNPATLPLAEVMTSDPEVLPDTATIAHLLNKMCVGGFRHVPVVDDRGRPVTVVSVKDVVELLVESFPREVLNLPEFDTPRIPKHREGA
jgi:CBS domain-containing protein